MTDGTGVGVEGRILRLERECRLLRGLLTAGALVLAGMVSMGQAAQPPKVVQAEGFQVIDSQGRVLATLGSDERLRCALKLHAESGEPQVVLGARPDGGAVLAFIENGKDPTCLLATTPGSMSGLNLGGPGKASTVGLNVSGDMAGISFHMGEVGASMGVLKGNAEVFIGKGSRHPSAAITRYAAGDVCLKLWDKEGKLLHCIPEGAHPESNPK
jgi:hypothetical protein